MIGLWLGRSIGAWFGQHDVVEVPAVRTVQPRTYRSRTLRRVPKRLIERELQTPDGPLRILVPDDWTDGDLLDLTTALVLADAL